MSPVNRRTILLVLWLLSDILLFVGSYAFAYFLRVGFILSSDFPFGPYIRTVMLTAPATIAILAQLGVFRLMRAQSSARNMLHVVFACAMGLSLFTLAYYFLHTSFFSRLLLLYAFILSTGSLIVWHVGFERIMRNLLRMKRPLYPTLIIGATREAGRLIRKLNEERSPLCPVAVLDGRGTKESSLEGVPVEGKLNKLEDTIRKHGITHLIQCSDGEQTLNLLSACRSHGITYALLPSVLGIVEGDERIESIEGYQATVVRADGGWLRWFFG